MYNCSAFFVFAVILETGCQDTEIIQQGQEKLTLKDHSLYESKYRAYYDAGINFVSTRGYDEGYESFLSGQLRGGRLIECGCGEGFAAAMASDLGYEVLGIDSAPSAIEKAITTHASIHQNPRFEVGDVCDLGHLESSYFDILADIGCLHMIGDQQDAQQYMSQAFRVLKPCGHIFLQNRVTPEEAKVWFPGMEKWIDEWVAHSIQCVDDTVKQVFQLQEREVTVDVPIRLGAVSRNAADYVMLVTQAGFQVEHACVKPRGVNSPFELVVIAAKPVCISESP